MGDSKCAEAPRFLVKHDGKYYLAVAALEYDPAAAKTDAEKKGVAEVARYFEPRRARGMEAGLTAEAEGDAAAFGEPGIQVRAFSSAVAFGQATKDFD